MYHTMNKEQFATHMRAMGFVVKVSSQKHVTVSRNSEDVKKQDIMDYTTFEDRINTMSGIVVNKRKDDDHFSTVTVYFY